MRLLLLLLFGTLPLNAEFVPPAEKMQLFRRDALFLDANRQRLLAQDLLAVASRPSAIESSAQRRATAQLLALASNLAPKANAPKTLSKAFTTGAVENHVPVSNLETPLANISATVLYLLEDPSNSEHLTIAQLILDPLAIASPDLDIVMTRPSTRESPRWKKVVAPVEEFVTRQKAEPPKEAEAEMIGSDTPLAETPERENTRLNLPPFQDSLLVPVFTGTRTRAATVSSEAAVHSLSFQAKLKNSPGQLFPPVSQGAKSLDTSLATLRTVLGARHPEEALQRMQGRFRLGSSNYLDRNGQSLSLPMVLLAESFLSQRALLDDIIILGRVTENGEVEAPAHAWQFLEILLAHENEAPQRLIVAAELVPLFEAFLTKQKEDFFFDFDVLAVSSLEEACKLSFVGENHQELDEALSQFEEIRAVAKGKQTSVFVTNAHVLARLDQVLELEPRLLSAALLKKRGTSDYPAKFSTAILAAQLQSAVMPLARIPYTPSQELVAAELERIHSDCRANLDPLARWVALSDRKSYDLALDLANRVRTLARAKERYDKKGSGGEESFHASLFFNTYRAIQEEFYQLASETAKILNQSPPQDPWLED